jgi:hypothetical protein
LERTASDTPEEFWRDEGEKQPFGHVEASADLPPKVIDFDNQIPLIADVGTDHSLHPPPDLVKEVHDRLEREAQLHDALQHGSESHFDVSAQQEAEGERRSDYLRWDTNDATKDDTSDATNGSPSKDPDAISTKLGGKPRIDAAADPSMLQPVANQNFLPEGHRTVGTGVSGPSFLGLTDDHAPEYDDEEAEPDSHLRRNLALAILAAVMILAAVQWRSIRDYGLSYMQNGSMQVKPAAKGSPQNPPAVAADHSSHDLGLPPATAKAGAPAAVESSPNADRALPVQQPSTSQLASGSPQPKQADLPAVPDRKQPPAMSNPAANVPAANVPTNEPPAVVSHSEKPRPYHAADSASAVSPASAVPGVDEMKRANSASDAEARAAWLWKALSKGNPQAPIELAKMYVQGNGVVQSCDQAEVLLRSAAAKGNEQARVNLRQIRSRGGCSAR